MKKIAILLSILICLFSASCSLPLHSSFSNNTHSPIETPHDKSSVSSSENIDFSQFSILQNIKDGVPISDDMLLEYPHIYSAIKKKISVDDSSITALKSANFPAYYILRNYFQKAKTNIQLRCLMIVQIWISLLFLQITLFFIFLWIPKTSASRYSLEQVILSCSDTRVLGILQ